MPNMGTFFAKKLNKYLEFSAKLLKIVFRTLFLAAGPFSGFRFWHFLIDFGALRRALPCPDPPRHHGVWSGSKLSENRIFQLFLKKCYQWACLWSRSAWGPLGPPWGPTGVPLGRPGVPLGQPGSPLGLHGSLWGPIRPVCGPVGPVCGPIGPAWGPLGPPRGPTGVPLGRSLGSRWACLGPHWASMGSLCGSIEPAWGPTGPPWGPTGPKSLRNAQEVLFLSFWTFSHHFWVVLGKVEEKVWHRKIPALVFMALSEWENGQKAALKALFRAAPKK